MEPISVIGIFDIGKTNKKLFLFDEQYRIVFSKSVCLAETIDEDEDQCEDLHELRLFIHRSLSEVLSDSRFIIRAINFSAYGASLVFVNASGDPIAPLYNYLKPYPSALLQSFLKSYGGAKELAMRTAAPVMGSLNSGLQLFRKKIEDPGLFGCVRYALHLPQYLSMLLCGRSYSDITSIGCHTMLWNFNCHAYDYWVAEEGLLEKLAPLQTADFTITETIENHKCSIGIGLHDSSAAIIPYKVNFKERFLLVSTGTWCIVMDPFDEAPLTEEELSAGCLCYLGETGSPVKSSRLFAGYRHDEQVERIAKHFDCKTDWYKSIAFDPNLARNIRTPNYATIEKHQLDSSLERFAFSLHDLNGFKSPSVAYHQLIADIIDQQVISISILLRSGTDQLFVDGGFSRNTIYMNLLAAAFPQLKIYAARVAEASALGAALVIHNSWNRLPIPGDLVSLRRYE